MSTWCSLLVRTEPSQTRHRGLSLLLVDLKSEGVTIQPVWVMGGWRVNAVFYDNVRVPAKNLVGEENEGWKFITGNLDEERAMSFGGTETRLFCARLIHRLAGRADSLSESDLQTLGRFVTELEADRLLYLRVGLAAARGEDTSGVGPMSKAVLYSAARVIDARQYLLLDADMLVLDDLRPVFAALDACPEGSMSRHWPPMRHC